MDEVVIQNKGDGKFLSLITTGSSLTTDLERVPSTQLAPIVEVLIQLLRLAPCVVDLEANTNRCNDKTAHGSGDTDHGARAEPRAASR